jgi:hypothetical protein
MNHEIRIIGKYKNKKYLLFYLTMYGSNEKKEIIYGICRYRVTRHNSGIINEYFDNKRVTYDRAKHFKKYGLKLQFQKLEVFKGIESFGTFIPINECERIISELNEQKVYSKKRKKGFYYLNLEDFKGTINIQPIITTCGIKKIKDYFKPHNDKRKRLIIYTKSNPKVAIQILDVYNENKKKD